MSSPRVYRRAALERQSTPDRLDEMLVVARPHDWIAIAALALIAAAAGAWAWMGAIPLVALLTGRP